MTKTSESSAGSSQDDFWTEQDETMQRHDLFNSEGEDLGAAMGYFAVGTAVLCAAGLAIAAFALRS